MTRRCPNFGPSGSVNRGPYSALPKLLVAGTSNKFEESLRWSASTWKNEVEIGQKEKSRAKVVEKSGRLEAGTKNEPP